MQLDFDTLRLFGGKISEGGNLYFKGDNENSWCIIYSDLTSAQTENFYKIINPYGDLLIQNIYFFRYIQEAMLLFQRKKEGYFRNSFIIISGMESNRFVKSYLFAIYIKPKLNIPKLHFFHSSGNFDLVALYLELLNKEIIYRVIQSGTQTYLEIRFREIKFQLEFDQISKRRLSYLLGINDRKFSVRHHFISTHKIGQNLFW
jgi:hypothetical protein